MKRRGFTLVELIIATALLSVITVIVFQFLRQFLRLWQKSEDRREVVEESSGMAELLADDFSALQNGARGDLLAEWVPFDTDSDGLPDAYLPRIRLVRPANPAEVQRLEAGVKDPARAREGEALLEVCWALSPARTGKIEPDLRAEGLLQRAERLQGSQTPSLFDPTFFGPGNKPRIALNDVSGGILWLGMQFATQTTLLDDASGGGWKIGADLEDAATSWDAWGKGRPDAVRNIWNEAAKGMPAPGKRAALPRRARFEIELERESELKLRTRLERPVAATDASIDVQDGLKLPQEPGSWVKIDGEWMKILTLDGDTAGVQRGGRGTQAKPHEAGALVHFGRGLVREVIVRTHQEDWNL